MYTGEGCSLDTRPTVTGMKAESVGPGAGYMGGGGCERAWKFSPDLVSLFP